MKKQLRNAIIQKRLGLTAEDVHRKSQEILSHIQAMNLDAYQSFLIFMDFRNEVETSPIIRYLLAENKQVVLPRVQKEDHQLSLHTISDLDDLVLSSYGILEPHEDRQVDLSSVDYIFVPGVAFSTQGRRLGYGGGFYDRLLSTKGKTTPTVGLVFDFQILDHVPYEDHDVCVEALLSESGYRKV